MTSSLVAFHRQQPNIYKKKHDPHDCVGRASRLVPTVVAAAATTCYLPAVNPTEKKKKCFGDYAAFFPSLFNHFVLRSFGHAVWIQRNNTRRFRGVKPIVSPLIQPFCFPLSILLFYLSLSFEPFYFSPLIGGYLLSPPISNMLVLSLISVIQLFSSHFNIFFFFAHLYRFPCPSHFSHFVILSHFNFFFKFPYHLYVPFSFFPSRFNLFLFPPLISTILFSPLSFQPFSFPLLISIFFFFLFSPLISTILFPPLSFQPFYFPLLISTFFFFLLSSFPPFFGAQNKLSRV